jgi:hypothetical protein
MRPSPAIISAVMPVVPNAPDRPVGLPPRARSWRLGVSTLVLVLLALGTFWGSDDDFPFGPLRMYATSTSPSGRVGLTAVYGTTARGDEVKISPTALGMRGAELEGQLPRLIDHPELLGALARTYHDRFPDEPEFVHVRLQRNYKDLEDGEVVGRHSVVVAEWDLR